MYKIGITGGIASGKSTVVNWFINKGVTVIDADLVAREVVMPHSEGLEKVVSHFGTSIIDRQGKLQRDVLGRIVFSDPIQLEALNKILHELIFKRIEELCKTHEKEGKVGIILDIPLLFETKSPYELDEIWLVYATEEVRLKRLQVRNHYTVAEGLQRIHSQLPLDSKRSRSHVIIENDGDSHIELEARLATLWNEKKYLFGKD